MNSKTSEQALEGGRRDDGAGGSLGEQLRRARQARGMSLRTISDQTRITMRHLEAIESDDYKNLPGGIFNRSFIKAFARAVEFEEGRALDLYARNMRERGESADEVAALPQRARVYLDGDTSRSPALTFALSALLVGILCLGIYALYRGYERRYGGGPSTAEATPAAAGTNTQPAAQEPPTPQAAEASTADGLRIQVKARDRAFWVTARADEKPASGMLKPGEPKDFNPEKGLYLKFGKGDADKLEVVINGRTARLPAEAVGNDIEMNITKENYRQFLP